MAYKKLLISASRMKFKNRLDAPESILLRGSHLKFEPIRTRRLGCRGGGAIDFVLSISCISGTSVYLNFIFCSKRVSNDADYEKISKGRLPMRCHFVILVLGLCPLTLRPLPSKMVGPSQ